MISPAQIRAARALLGLSQAELATIADVSSSTTIHRIEKSDAKNQRFRKQSLLKLHAALEEHGIIFIPNGRQLRAWCETSGAVGIDVLKRLSLSLTD